MNQKGFANIILVVVIVILVGAVGYFVFVKKSAPVAEQPTPATTQTKTPTPTLKDETSSLKMYNNGTYGFELKYPTAWNLKNNALSFSTKNGYTATFGVESIVPTTKDFTIEEMRKEYDRTAGDNPRAPKASEVLKDVLLGSEAGLEWAGIACEQGNPCYAKYEFYSNNTWRKGFKFYLTIPNLKNSDMNSTYDPRPLFSDDIATARKVLSTFNLSQISSQVNEFENWKACVNAKYGYEAKYPPTWKVWKPGAPEARLANCSENLAIIALSPNLFEYPISRIMQINIDVSDQERLRGTIYEGSKSLDDYFAKNSAILQNSPKVKETTIDGEKLVWLEGNWLLSFHNGSIFEFRVNNVDSVILDNFIRAFKFH